MRKGKCFLVLAIVLLGVVISVPYALAAPLGYATPSNWAGSGARVNIYDSNGGVYTPEKELSTTPNGTTSVYYGSGASSASSESSAYVLKGTISNAENTQLQAGGYFRDELYFATYNGLPAELALTFSVAASGYVYGPSMYAANTGSAWLNIGLNVPIVPLNDPISWYSLDNQFLVNTNMEGEFSTYSNVTLKSTFFDSTNLIQSGTYLPFTVSLWGLANNAYLDWGGNTVELLGVQAFQGGVLLDESQFTILSKNNEGYFSDFAHGTEPTNPVPIPAAAWLLGTGLISLVGLRRKFKL